MFPQLDDTPTVFDELTQAKNENRKLKIENERLKKRIDKNNLFEQMLKDLITEHFGITEFSAKQTIHGILSSKLNSIPELVKLVDKAKEEKTKWVKPKFELWQRVEWSGYGREYSGLIEKIEIEIKDDGEPLITYYVGGVGQYWESELELSK